MAKRSSLEPECVDQLIFLHSALSAKCQDKVRNIRPVAEKSQNLEQIVNSEILEASNQDGR